MALQCIPNIMKTRTVKPSEIILEEFPVEFYFIKINLYAVQENIALTRRQRALWLEETGSSQERKPMHETQVAGNLTENVIGASVRVCF